MDAAQADLAEGGLVARPGGDVGGRGGKHLNLGPDQTQGRGQPVGVFFWVAQEEEPFVGGSSRGRRHLYYLASTARARYNYSIRVHVVDRPMHAIS